MYYGSVSTKMEVTVIINLGGSPREITHTADSEQKVQNFIIDVCQHEGIPHSSGVVLSNESGVVLKMSQTLSHYSIQEGSVVKLITLDTGYSKGCGGCNQWWLLAVVAFLIGVAGISAIVVIKCTSGDVPNAYGIVFDAGSSHTQMYIYKWEGDKENGTAVPHQIHSARAEGGGISDYEDNPSQAGESVQSLVHDARKHIPGSQFVNTDLYLGATAGMRLLRARNKSLSEAIMTSIMDTFEKAPFKYEDPEAQSRIIDGKEEGSFGWVTVNYLDDKFELFDKKDTYGSLDLGGASTQITFVPQGSVDEKYVETLVLYGYEYDVYTHSYLCYGSNEAHRQYLASLVLDEDGATTVTDPCLPTGNATVYSYEEVFEAPCTNKTKPSSKADFYTFIGSSNSSQCNDKAQKIFNFNASCGHPEEKCTFNGVYQPAVRGKFKAFSQFYYTMQFLNISKDASLEEFRTATDEFCALSWEDIKDQITPPSSLKYVTQYCFNSHYIDILLTKGYKFDASNWNTISFTNKIHDTELGWSLGFMTNVSNTIAAQTPSQPIQLTMFVIYTILFAVFILLAVAFACHARQSRRTPADAPYSRLGDA